MSQPAPAVSPPLRRAILGLALAAGLAAVLAGDGPEGSEGPAGLVGVAAAAPVLLAQSAPEKAAEKAIEKATERAAEAAEKAADRAAQKAAEIDAEISIGEKGVVIRKRDGERGVVVRDRRFDEFESFDEFVETAPWLAGLVFMVTALVFVVPLLIIVLLVWYKMRRTRMLNETMLKLAERGVVPPGEALATLAGERGQSVPPGVAPAAAPLYEQAKSIRRKTVRSDLRNGVIMTGVGLGLTLWSMIDDASANPIGLILLFVGIGYVVLWYLEDRRVAEAPRNPIEPGGGA
jgi:hypothetical protein